jgi:hypothetical protein
MRFQLFAVNASALSSLRSLTITVSVVTTEFVSAADAGVPKLAAAKPRNLFVCNNLPQHKIRQIRAFAGIGRPQPKLVVFGQGWAALAELNESTTARIPHSILALPQPQPALKRTILVIVRPGLQG